MIDSGSEVDLRRLEGVVGREVDGQEEDAALEWRVALPRVSAISEDVYDLYSLDPL